MSDNFSMRKIVLLLLGSSMGSLQVHYSPRKWLLKFDEDCLAGISVVNKTQSYDDSISVQGDVPSAPARVLLAKIQQKASKGSSKFSFQYLGNLKLFLIGNPHLSMEEAKSVFKDIPCLDYFPRPDRFWGQGQRSTTQQHKNQYARRLQQLDQPDFVVLDPFIMAAATNRQMKSQFVFSLPSDPLIRTQWHLFGPAQGVPYGIGAIDAWTAAVIQIHPNHTGKEAQTDRSRRPNRSRHPNQRRSGFKHIHHSRHCGCRMQSQQ